MNTNRSATMMGLMMKSDFSSPWACLKGQNSLETPTLRWRTRLLEALGSSNLDFKQEVADELDRWSGWERISPEEGFELQTLLGSLNRDLLWRIPSN